MAESNKIDYKPWLILAGIGFAYFGVLTPLLEKLGLWKDKDTHLVDDVVGDGTDNPFDPNFYKQEAGATILSSAYANNFADTIYTAFGGFNDNEEQVIGIFRALHTQSQCSHLAAVFHEKYHEDLLTWLKGGWWPQDRLSDADLATIIRIVKSKPKFKV